MDTKVSNEVYFYLLSMRFLYYYIQLNLLYNKHHQHKIFLMFYNHTTTSPHRVVKLMWHSLDIFHKLRLLDLVLL